MANFNSYVTNYQRICEFVLCIELTEEPKIDHETTHQHDPKNIWDIDRSFQDLPSRAKSPVVQ